MPYIDDPAPNATPVSTHEQLMEHIRDTSWEAYYLFASLRSMAQDAEIQAFSEAQTRCINTEADRAHSILRSLNYISQLAEETGKTLNYSRTLVLEPWRQET